METIVVAIITGIFSVIAVIITNMTSNKKIEVALDKKQAITDTKLEALTDEVREHNNFARRMPVVEEKIDNLDRRITKLESK